jgi:hypothetical protein
VEAREEVDYLHENTSRKDAVYLVGARVEFDYSHVDRKDAVYLVEPRVEFDYLHEERKDAVYTWWRQKWKMTTCTKTERMLSVWRMPESCCLPSGG